MYHFLSGYTAKVAGTEVGVTEPTVTFSACFGAAFMVWHPTKYATLLAERIRAQRSGVAREHRLERRSVRHRVANQAGLHACDHRCDPLRRFAQVPTVVEPHFGLEVPQQCPGVPDKILLPKRTWADEAAYQRTAEKLIGMFRANSRSTSNSPTKRFAPDPAQVRPSARRRCARPTQSISRPDRADVRSLPCLHARHVVPLPSAR